MNNPPQKPISSLDAPNTAQPKDRDPAPESGRSCLWRIISVGVWISLLLLLLIIGFRIWFLSRFDAAKRAEMDRFENEVITLPPDWQTAAKVPSKAVMDFHQHFQKEMIRLVAKYPDAFGQNFATFTSGSLLSRLQNHDDITTGEKEMLPAMLAELRPLVQRTSAATALPDYTANIPLFVTGIYSNIQLFGTALEVDALLSLRAGKYRHAVEMAILPIRLLRREPRPQIMDHRLACSIIEESSRVLYSVAEVDNDLSALHHTLALMDEVSDIAHPRDIDLWPYADWASNLAAMKATGYPVDLSPQPLAGYMDQNIELAAPKFNEWLIKNLPASDPRVKIAKGNIRNWNQALEGNREYWVQLLMRGFRFRGLSEIVLGYKAITLIDGVPASNSFEDIPYRARVSSAKFDLARLRIAQRITELQTAPGTTATSATAITSSTITLGPEAIAATMPTVPDDPFSSPTAPLRFSKSLNRFYSVGADGDDDGMKIEYDVDHGFVSDGDVFLNP